MSDTDKDQPYWVTAVWYEAQHTCGEHTITGWQRRTEPCNLPAEPVRHRRDASAWRTKSCVWVACWERHRWFRSPSKDAVRVYWNGPQRRAVRDDSRTAIAEYRATGEVDVIHETRQARHGVTWTES